MRSGAAGRRFGALAEEQKLLAAFLGFSGLAVGGLDLGVCTATGGLRKCRADSQGERKRKDKYLLHGLFLNRVFPNYEIIPEAV